ncbi:MAG: hypothetical protein FRX49_00527 [Trebouxia sp. A1-2]|nr:MAG: hypothetical protein FRX49_00527 [Trebouxia sp. A1-2]
MQAHVFAAVIDNEQVNSSSPTGQQLRDVLAVALTSAVWQASDGKSASVVCCKQVSTSGLSYDQLCQSAAQLPCKSRAKVEAAFHSQLGQFQEPYGYGLLLLLFSLLLTHGIRQTKADMDEPDTCLIAAHGYCSQDLVNLVLTGHAVTNCFNGKRDVAGKMCQGVQQRSRLGFLSLFEWFGYTQVGSHLKDPALPIWVVCSESHFTILYRLLSHDRHASGTASSGSDLTLMYYDGLANQEQPIKLTVSKALQPDGTAIHYQTGVVQHKGNADNGLVPPLEHVLHTKWPEATVHWSGCEPIL